MRKFFIFLAIPSLVFALVCGAGAGDWNMVNCQAALPFAKLPKGVSFPEGITANPHTGEIIVGTFNFDGNNYLLRFKSNGHLVARKFFDQTPLLGLAFNRKDKNIYIANFGASMIQRISADFTAATPVEEVASIPGIGAPPDRLVDNPDGSQDVIMFGSNDFPSPNGLVFNSVGDLFISDSFQGAIFRIDNADSCTTPCPVTEVAHDPLLATAGFPPFGANGLALNADETVLFIANTGDDRVLTLDLDTPDPSPEIFAESINGADGIAFDKFGRLWVAGNQADQVVVLNQDGRVIFELGEFFGISKDGSPRGLLFPASFAIKGEWVFVTNLALPLTPVEGDEPEEDVTTYTVSRIKIPNQPTVKKWAAGHH